ncbi:MAG: DUF975 family protein, partial [Lachnospiraceae bacterium]|nr:DUF975 family protein [Lachnospiraceae bacterium]
MYSYMTAKQLKDSARHRLSVAGSSSVAATALFFGITFLISAGISTFTINASTMEVSPLYYVCNYFSSIISNILLGGFSYMMLKMYCGHSIQLGDLFYAFTRKGRKLLAVSTLFGSMSYLILLPADILSSRFMHSFSMYDGALFFFASALYLVLLAIIELFYALVNYIAIDFPDYNTFHVFRISAHLMNGHKARLFYITVSFIPMLLLGCLTCGILLLWIFPMMQAVY